MTKPYYWHAKMPSGQWGVLWYRPEHDAHVVVATTTDEARAEQYAIFENDLIDEPVTEVVLPRGSMIAESFEKKTNFIKSVMVDLQSGAAEVLKDLPALFAAYPTGFGAQELRDRYKYTYSSSLEILRFLDATGKGRFIFKSGKGGPKIFVANDSEIVETDLSRNQEAVLFAMRSAADKHGLCSTPVTEIARIANRPTGSVPSTLYALEQKGKIMVSKPGNNFEPTVYQILE